MTCCYLVIVASGCLEEGLGILTGAVFGLWTRGHGLLSKTYSLLMWTPLSDLFTARLHAGHVDVDACPLGGMGTPCVNVALIQCVNFSMCLWRIITAISSCIAA